MKASPVVNRSMKGTSMTTLHASGHRLQFLALTALALGLFTIAAIPQMGSAHEERTIGDVYDVVVGFTEEPAIADEMNGVLLEVSNAGVPVEGIADTLQVQLIWGDQTKDLALTPIFDQPGGYKAPFIPTVEGDYTFRFFGEIEGVAIDETFISSPGGFDSVQPRSTYEFPAKEGESVDRVAMPAVVAGAVLVISAGVLAIRRHNATVLAATSRHSA